MRTLAVVLLALTMAGCGGGIADSDRVLIRRFFAASRLRDLTALRNFSTVVFEPATDGIVTNLDVVDVTVRASGVKDLSVVAPVKMPSGETVSKRIVLTIEHGQITAFSERPESPSTPRP